MRVLLNPENQQIEIFAKNADVGENRSNLPAKIEGELVEISFNYKFLIDGMAHIKSSEIFFDISKEDGPCLLRPVGDENYLYVVMPIKAV